MKRIFMMTLAVCLAATLMTGTALAYCLYTENGTDLPDGHRYEGGQCVYCGVPAPVLELVTDESMLTPGDKYVIGRPGEGLLGIDSSAENVNGSVVTSIDTDYLVETGRIRLDNTQDDPGLYTAEFVLREAVEYGVPERAYSLISTTGYSLIIDDENVRLLNDPLHLSLTPVSIAIEPYDAVNDQGGGATIRGYVGGSVWGKAVTFDLEHWRFAPASTGSVYLLRCVSQGLTHVEAKEPTCSGNGWVEYWYDDVNDIYYLDEAGTVPAEPGDVILPALAHIFDTYEYDENEHWRVCSVCGEADEERIAHARNDWGPDPEDPDLHCWICIDCGYKATEAHNWTETDDRKDPTCTEDGWKTRICMNCQTEIREVLPATGHTMLEGWLTDNENHYHLCDTCKEHFDEEPHAFGAPQNLGDNIKAHFVVCEVCGYRNSEPHQFVAEVTKPATPEEDGEVRYTCSLCGMSYTETFSADHSHVFEHHDAVEPTCTEPGMAAYEACVLCGKCFDVTGAEVTPDRLVIPAPGHSMDLMAAHESTCVEPGLVQCWYCFRCGKYFTIPAVEEGRTMTRGALAALLAETFGWENTLTESPFTDVTPDRDDYDGILACFAHQGLLGVGDGRFAPDQTVTRAEAAVVFMRIGDLDDVVPTWLPSDIPSDAWYRDGALAVIAYEIMYTDEELFRPNDPLKGGEFDLTYIVDITGRCGHECEDPTLPLLPHDWSEWEVLETVGNMKQRVCHRCSLIETEEIIKNEDDRLGIVDVSEDEEELNVTVYPSSELYTYEVLVAWYDQNGRFDHIETQTVASSSYSTITFENDYANTYVVMAVSESWTPLCEQYAQEAE